MNYRRLGRTGLTISEIGFGAWGIGKQMWRGADDAQSLRALHAAVDGGVTFIDTALIYGRGHSERLIGQVSSQRHEKLTIATKIPPLNMRWPAEGALRDAFPAAHIRKCVDESLANLQRDCVDVVQLHVWNPAWLAEQEWFDTLSDLRQQGKLRWFGVSLNDHQPQSGLELVRSGKVDTVQCIYNIFDQAARDELLGTCREHDVGVIARVPFDEGALTGKVTPDTTFSKKDWRNHYFSGDRKRQVYERIRQLEAFLKVAADSLPELALKFCLEPDAVSTVIPGMRSIAHVQENIAVSQKPPLQEAVLEQLKQHRWEKNFYDE